MLTRLRIIVGSVAMVFLALFLGVLFRQLVSSDVEILEPSNDSAYSNAVPYLSNGEDLTDEYVEALQEMLGCLDAADIVVEKVEFAKISGVEIASISASASDATTLEGYDICYDQHLRAADDAIMELATG